MHISLFQLNKSPTYFSQILTYFYNSFCFTIKENYTYDTCITKGQTDKQFIGNKKAIFVILTINLITCIIVFAYLYNKTANKIIFIIYHLKKGTVLPRVTLFLEYMQVYVSNSQNNCLTHFGTLIHIFWLLFTI